MWRSTFTELALGTFLTLVLTGILMEQNRIPLPAAPLYGMVAPPGTTSPSVYGACCGSTGICLSSSTTQGACNGSFFPWMDCSACPYIPPNPCPNGCYDGDACTQDICTSGGCYYQEITDCCSSDSECTSTDPCWLTSCISNRCFGMYNPVCCDDGNPCTTDFGSGPGNCDHYPIPGCGSSSSSYSPPCPNGCFDADVCTTDVCTSGGCTHEPIADCCNDDGDCASDDPCWLTACISNQCFGMYDNACCDDGNSCTSDYADSGGGCHHDPIPNCGSSSAPPTSSAPSTSSASSAPPQQQCMDQHHVSACPTGSACLPVGSHPCSQNIPCCDTSGNFTQPSFGCCATTPCKTQSNTCTAPSASSAPPVSSAPPASSSRPTSSSPASSSFYSSSSSEDLVSCCFNTYCSDDVPASLCTEFGAPAEDPIFGGGNGLCDSDPCGHGAASSSPQEPSSSAGFSSSAASSSSQQGPSSAAASASSQSGPSSANTSSEPNSSSLSFSSAPNPSSSSNSSQPTSSASSSSSACADTDKKSCCYDENGKHYCENDVCPEDCKKHGVSPYPINGACSSSSFPLFSYQWFTAWLTGAKSGTEVKYCPVPNTACCRSNCSLKYYDQSGNEKTVPGTYKFCSADSNTESCGAPLAFTKQGTTYNVSCAGGALQELLECKKNCNTTNQILCCLPDESPPKTTVVFGGQCSSLGGYEVQMSSDCKVVLIDCCTDRLNKKVEKKTSKQCSSPAFAVTPEHECKVETDCAKIDDGNKGTYMGCTWQQTAGQCSSSTIAKEVSGGVCCCPKEQNCCRPVSVGSQTNFTCTREGPSNCAYAYRDGSTYYGVGAVLDSCSTSEGGNCTNTNMEAGCCCNLKTGTFAGTTSMWLSFPLWGGIEKQSPQQLCTETYKGGFTKASGMGGKSCDNTYCEGEQTIACCPPKPANIAAEWKCTTAKKSEKATKCDANPPKEFTGSMCPTGDAAYCRTPEKKVPCCSAKGAVRPGMYECYERTPTECKDNGWKQLSGDKCPTGDEVQKRCDDNAEKVSCCERPSESAAWTCSVKKASECNDPVNKIALGKTTAETCQEDWTEKCKKPEDTIACCPLQANESGKWDCIDVKKSEEGAKCQKGSTFGQLKCASINPPPTCYKPPERTVACCSTKGSCWQLSLQEGQTCDTKNNPGLDLIYSPTPFDPPSGCNQSNCKPKEEAACCTRASESVVTWSCSVVTKGTCGTGPLHKELSTKTCPANLEDASACGPIEKPIPCCKQKADKTYDCVLQTSCGGSKPLGEKGAVCPASTEIQDLCKPEKKTACCTRASESTPWSCAVVESECVDGDNVKNLGEGDSCPSNWKEQCKDKKKVACCKRTSEKHNWNCYVVDESSCTEDANMKNLGEAQSCPANWKEKCVDITVPCCYWVQGDGGPGTTKWNCVADMTEDWCNRVGGGKKMDACPADRSDESMQKVCGDGEKTVACCPKTGGYCATGMFSSACDDSKPINESNSCTDIKCQEEETWCCYRAEGAAADSCNKMQSTDLVNGECPWKGSGGPYDEKYPSEEACGKKCIKTEDKKTACCKKNDLIDGQYDCPEKQGSCPAGSTEMDMAVCTEKGCPEEKNIACCVKSDGNPPPYCQVVKKEEALAKCTSTFEGKAACTTDMEASCKAGKMKTACCTLPPAQNGGGSFEATECKEATSTTQCTGELKGTPKGSPSANPCSPNPCEPKMVPCCQKAGTSWTCSDLNEENCKDPNLKVTACPAKPEDCGSIACCQKNPDGTLTGVCGLGTCSNTSKEQPALSSDGRAIFSCTPNPCKKQVACCEINATTGARTGSCGVGESCVSPDMQAITADGKPATSCTTNICPKQVPCCVKEGETMTCKNMNDGDCKLLPKSGQCPTNQQEINAQCDVKKVPCCVKKENGTMTCTDVNQAECKLQPKSGTCPTNQEEINTQCGVQKVSCCVKDNIGKETGACEQRQESECQGTKGKKVDSCEPNLCGEKAACCLGKETGSSECREISSKESCNTNEKQVKDMKTCQEKGCTPYVVCCAQMNKKMTCADLDEPDSVYNQKHWPDIVESLKGKSLDQRKSQCLQQNAAGTPSSVVVGTGPCPTACGLPPEKVPCCIQKKADNIWVDTGECRLELAEKCTNPVDKCSPNPCTKPEKKVTCIDKPGTWSLATCVACRGEEDSVAQISPAPTSPLRAQITAQVSGGGSTGDGWDVLGDEFEGETTEEAKQSCISGGCPVGAVRKACCSPASGTCSVQLLGINESCTSVTGSVDGPDGRQYDDNVEDTSDCNDYCATFKGTAGSSAGGEQSSAGGEKSSSGAGASSSEEPETGNCCVAGEDFGLCFANFDQASCIGTALGNEQCIESPATGSNCGPTDEGGSSSGGASSGGSTSSEGSSSSGNGSSSSSPCGNGTVDEDEECDNGTANSNSPNALCRTDCKKARCGDGIKDSNPSGRDKEACDDGDDCSDGHACNSDTGTATCKTTCKNRNTFFTIGQWLHNLQLYAVNGTPVPNAPVTNEQTKFIIIGVLTFILQ